MGRRKLMIKRIENKSSRQVTFTKRRNGLMKKASDLSILCDVSVAVVVISSSLKLYDFSSGDSIAEIIKLYQNHLEADPSMESSTLDYSKYAAFLPLVELQNIVQSQLKEWQIEQLSVHDLNELGKQLDSSVSAIQEKKTQLLMDIVASLREKEKVLVEENTSMKQQMVALKPEGDAIMVLTRNQESSLYPRRTLQLLR